MTAIAWVTWVTLHPLAYFLLANAERAPAWRSRGWLLLYLAILAVFPFQIAPGALFWRAAAATVAVSYAVKAFELARGKVRDPSIRHSFWRCALWLMVPHDPRWPNTASERSVNRRKGGQQLGRALLKAVCGLALTFLGSVTPPDLWPFLVSAAVTAFQFYFFATAIADVVGALALLQGCSVDEIFITPFSARSPADFWSRKWNLYIARFGARYVFFPWRKLGVPWASFLVFVASALMHEYIVLAIFGPKAKLGYMSAFFMVHWLGVTAHYFWLRKARGRAKLRAALAIALHFIWFMPTTILFFEPVGEFLRQWWIIWRPIPW